jgi:hypothetical protein
LDDENAVASQETQSAVIRLLKVFLNTGHDEPFPEADPASVVEAAMSFGVIGPLNRALNSLQERTLWQDQLRESLASAFLKHSAAMIKLHEEARTIAGALADAKVPHVFYKGPFLSYDLYGDATLRRSADVDLILPQGRMALPAARAALGQIGYRMPDVHPALIQYYETENNELPMGAPGRPFVDMHHAPYDDFPRDAFLEVGTRAARASGDVPGRVRMSGIDTLMFLCAHYWTVPRGTRIKWLVDCAALFMAPATFKANWIGLVRRWRFSFYLVVTARATRKVLGAGPFPPGIHFLEKEFDEEEKGICERITAGGPDSLPDGLVQKVHRLRLPKEERRRITRKYIWPHPGKIMLDNPGVRQPPGLFGRLLYAVARAWRAFRTR